MTLTIEIPDDQVNALQARAASAGLSPEAWLKALAAPALAAREETAYSIVPLQKSDPESWARQFDVWVDSHRRDIPVLSDEAMSRSLAHRAWADPAFLRARVVGR
jgi:hypothetical protein